MRLPLAVDLESRDGALDQDALIKNGIVESRGEAATPVVRKRPGLTDLGLVRAGAAQMLYYWNSKIRSVIGDYLGATTGATSETLGSWSSCSLPSSNLWGLAAHDGTGYAACVINISTGSTVAAYSSNGTSWTAATLSETLISRIMIGGGGYFVVAGYNSSGNATDKACRSVDHGATWSDVTLPSSQLWHSGCYNSTDNAFLLISTQTSVTAISFDGGATWSAGGSMPANRSWSSVCWCPELSKYIAVALDGGQTNNIAYSSDGVTWTSVTHASGLAFSSVSWNGTIAVAWRSSETTYYTSLDGASWVARTSPYQYSSQVIDDGLGRFILFPATGVTNAHWSSDGITWTSSTLSNSVFAPSYGRIAAADGDGQVVSVRYSGGSSYDTGNVASFGTNISSSSANLSPSSADLQFSAQDNGESAGERLLMIKNATQGWTVDTSDTATAITDVDYPGAYKESVVSLTRSSTTATAQVVGDTKFKVGDVVTIAGANESDYNGAMTITAVTKAGAVINGEELPITITRSSTTATATCTSGPHGLVTGDTVTITGAEQGEYNGAKTITRTGATTFTFTVTETAAVPATSASPASPATGTISLTQGGGSIAIVVHEVSPAAGTWAVSGRGASIIWTVGQSVTLAMDGYPVTQSLLSATHTVGSLDSYGRAVITTAAYSSYSPYSGYTGSWLRGPVSVSSITSNGSGLATVTTATPHYLTSGMNVIIAGANQAEYNGAFSVSITGASTFTYQHAFTAATSGTSASPATPATGTIKAQKASTLTGASFQYTVANSPTTPATGTITAAINRETVPGIAYLNGYFCVMDERGVIFNSAQDDPQAWNALDFTTAQNETGAGVAIARSQNYLVAFKEWSTEFFYDAKNAVGSPFSPVENAFTQIGCANGWSIASVDGMLIWVSQARQKGRSVHVMSGMEQRKVSTAAVDRVLNADALTTIYAYCVKLDGHPLYVLTLTGSSLTLVYDIASGVWTTWTACTIGSSKSVTSITRSGVIATVTTGTAHGLSDGDPVQISGAGQSAYNGIFNALVTSTTAFEIQVSGSPATPATGTILAYPFSESYFDRTHYCNAGGVDVTLHKTDGHLYEIDPSTGQDDGVPINFFIRTQRLDGGANARKRLAAIGLVGVTVSDTAAIRWSDNDCSTYVAYRPIDLSLDDPTLRRCGAFRRRAFEVRHVGDGFPIFEALEMDPGG